MGCSVVPKVDHHLVAEAPTPAFRGIIPLDDQMARGVEVGGPVLAWRFIDLGFLEVKDYPARTGRDPATGETVQIAASKKIAFRPAKDLKPAI